VNGTDADSGPQSLGFNELLLIGVVILIVTGVTLGMSLYLFSPNRIEVAELQPSVRIARESDFPSGASRTVNWGDQIILVVRSPDRGYFALQGVSSGDGCILRWDLESLRVTSPCSHLVYDLHGNVVSGLTNQPLRRYPVFVRGGVVYVTSE
jgi:nitrite reductase/ring-hydroxylating ferredoxin subunit